MKNNSKKRVNKRRENSRAEDKRIENKKSVKGNGSRHSKTREKGSKNRNVQLDKNGNKVYSVGFFRKKMISEEEFRKKKKRRKIRLIVFIIIFIIWLIYFAVSVFKWNRIMKDVITCKNSVVVDSTGNVIGVLGGSRIQETVSLNTIPDDLEHAYVAIEDKNFYKHNGVNIKRTAGAIGSYIVNRGSASYGGSTITQQLVKNVTGENETKISRKVVEWDRAIKTEMVLSKNQILQTYLNIIYVGPNVYGVQMGSRYYFNKNVDELDLAECAFLAGINHSPNSYNPFNDDDNEDKIKSRTITVLKVMLEQEYISRNEYNNAVEEVNDGLYFDEGDVESKYETVNSYMVDATVSEVINDLKKEKKMSESFATNYLYYSGLKIYCTQNSDIQEDLEDEFSKKQYMIKSSTKQNATAQAAMVIIDQKNGQVKGCVGGLGEKNTARGFNRATQAKRQTGSAIKPIAILGPALEEKIITPVSIYDDKRTVFANGYSPIDCERELGEITVRRAVESSQNIPFVKMMEELTPKKSIEYMEKEGITTLTEKDCDLPLALGGLEKGTTPLEMAVAYACIANGGEYIEPIFYTKVNNSKGKTVLKNKQTSRNVFSEDTAYVLKKLLTEPINGQNGTAKMCKIDGFEVAAKTGTTNDNYDKWLCGFTEFYTGVVWYGFDANETIMDSAEYFANQIWANVMENVHEDLINTEFQKPNDVEEVIICKDSGKLANSGCKNTYVEYFRKGTVIKEKCGKH